MNTWQRKTKKQFKRSKMVLTSRKYVKDKSTQCKHLCVIFNKQIFEKDTPSIFMFIMVKAALSYI